MTAVCALSIDLIEAAASGICHALTASSTASTGPALAGSSVALTRGSAKSPLMLSTRKPRVRSASSVGPRAIKRVSIPACAGMPPACVNANAAQNLLIAVDEMQAACRIEADQHLDIIGIDSAMIAARLPGVGRVVAVLVFLNPDLGLRKEVGPVRMVPVGVGKNHVGDVLRPRPGVRHCIIGTDE